MSGTNRRAFLQQSTLAGVACWTAGGKLSATAAENKAAEDRLPVLTLEGSPHNRGLIHGKMLKDSIHELMKLWKADLSERYKMDAAAFIKRFLKNTGYVTAIKKWTPDLLEEVNGISVGGAGIDFETMLVFQLIDEYWVNGPGVAGEHCSALGVGRRGDHPSYVAQNMDLEGFRNGFQTILRIQYPKSKREALVLTHSGLIALNGLNNRAIGICCNTLSQLANCRDGLPVACAVRGVLQQETEDAALKFLREIKHASGQNYIIGGPNQVYAFECSAGKVSRFTPPSGTDRVWHTNHPLINDDYSAAYRKTLEQKENAKKADNSSLRLQSLQSRLGKDRSVVDLNAIKAALAAKDTVEHPVCRPYKNQKSNFTFASTIMVLAEKPAMHVAPGPPDIHPYQLLA